MQLPYRLGIDFGTSTTVAMLRWPDGRIRPLLFDGSPLLASGVLLDPDGQIHTGRDAAHLARRFPARLEPNPKRRVDEGTVLLGDTEVDLRDVVASVLRRVAAEARQVAGDVRDVTLTHPVGWGPVRRALLVDAAGRAGFDRPRLVAEPVAAATYLTHLKGAGLAPDANVLIYDLGAGTCDVTLLRRRDDGFEVTGSAGLNDVGGLDIDAAIVSALRAVHGDLWHDEAGRRQLWDEVRAAKEMLSRTGGTVVAVVGRGLEVPLGRQQFDDLAFPVLRPTVDLVATLLDGHRVDPADVGGLFLVGGSSRIPLIGTLLHRALGVTPVVTEQPELVVAEGSLYDAVAAAQPGGPPFPLPVTAAPAGPLRPGEPPRWPPPGAPAGPARPAAGVWRPVALGVAAVLATAIVLVTVLVQALPDEPGGLRSTTVGASAVGPSAGSAAGPSAGARPGAADRTGAGSGPTTSAGPSVGAGKRHDFRSLSATVCARSDTTALAKWFEQPDREPDLDVSAGGSFSTSRCYLSLTHNSRGSPIASAIVGFGIWVFTDQGSAADHHRDTLDEASLANRPVTAHPGVGEHAFGYRKSGDTAAPVKEIEYVFAVRDGNLTFDATVSIFRVSEEGWTTAERSAIEAAFVTAAKASYARIVTA